VTSAELDAFCRDHGFVGWFETSAKTNHNIEEGVRGLVAAILSHPDAFEAQRLLSASKSATAGASVAIGDKKAEAKTGAGESGGCCPG
jgi:hypothetical protein